MTVSQLRQPPNEGFKYSTPILYSVSKRSLLLSAVVVAVLLRWSVNRHGSNLPCFQIHGTLLEDCYE